MLTGSDAIVLRRLAPRDLAIFLAYRKDPDIARFQSWEAMTESEARGFLHAMEQVTPVLRPGEWTRIAVADAATDELIGDMGLHLSGDATGVELGITLAAEHHRKGHATAAMTLAIGYVFRMPSVTAIICGASRRNTPSLNLIRKLGFQWTHSEKVPAEDGRPGDVDEMFRIERPGLNV